MGLKLGAKGELTVSVELVGDIASSKQRMFELAAKTGGVDAPIYVHMSAKEAREMEANFEKWEHGVGLPKKLLELAKKQLLEMLNE